MFHTAI
nr:unnamed protein product [Callosobruchus analis]